MICAACDREVGDDISVFHTKDFPDQAILGIKIVCHPCGQDIINLLRARGLVLDPLTGEVRFGLPDWYTAEGEN